MAHSSRIEWTEATWNPVTGCTKISAGCANCYAERLAKRLQAMGKPRYANGFEVTLHPEVLPLPTTWRKPRLVFVNSMSDLFHEKIPFDFVARVFDVMNACPRHTFQVLTKRPHVARAYRNRLKWSSNIWMGATIEDSSVLHRLTSLLHIPAAIRFVSAEPLLAHLPGLRLDGIDWVIVGGESGPGARPMDVRWVREIRSLCARRHVPFFFKQWGGTNKKSAGRMLDGRTWDDMPDPLPLTGGLSHDQQPTNSLAR